jgi:hypothetical protein
MTNPGQTLVPSITMTIETAPDDERAEVAAAAIRSLAADIAEHHGVALRVEPPATPSDPSLSWRAN